MTTQKVDAHTHIIIKGARVHNLKNISLAIPRNRFVVITGVSGSGKSSLAFDTLYAEGQRRYVESLSSYARQFLGRINKPEVDYIKGIPPAIAIEQKVNTRNPRSTVGTSTETYEYIKLLFARAGHTFSPASGMEVKRHHVSDVVDHINALPLGTRVAILAPVLPPEGRLLSEHLNILQKQGFGRIEVNGSVMRIDDFISSADKAKKNSTVINLVIDRISVNSESEDNNSRLGDSVQTAFYEGRGECIVKVFDETAATLQATHFSNRFEADGIVFDEPSEQLFAFNNPLGACPVCEGFGSVIGIDEDLVIPNRNLSVYDGAVACWNGDVMSEWKEALLRNAHKFNFPVHKPFYELTDDERKILWEGNRHFYGINDFFSQLEEKSYKIQNRVMLARYRGKTVCRECGGTRLRKEAAWVKVSGKCIHELVTMPITGLAKWFASLRLNEHDSRVAQRLLIEINSRLDFLTRVGLGYLTLNRLSSSLSGGESQRINIATSLGSSLVGSLYILDEPSIGLHSRDTQLLIGVLKKLRDLGNTVVVVEHDEEIIRACDEIIDIGPGAGQHGGEVVYQGKFNELTPADASLTTQFLTGIESIAIPPVRRRWNRQIELTGVRENNLKGFSVSFPLNVLTVVTGVSGSGKSSLVKKILYPALKKLKGGVAEQTGNFGLIKGDVDAVSDVEFIDQNPIGKSSRSNPATYLKVWDEIRKLMSDLKSAQQAGLKPAHFSFNIEGGRCEECQGEGFIKVEMQFMADVILTCESCNGQRFKQEVLDIAFNGKNVFDILEMTVDEAISFFERAEGNTPKRIAAKLKPLADVGLGYVRLGQSSSTLSGGESQRVKLASFLMLENNDPTLFIFDEPTTGLHFGDIRKLLKAFDALLQKGHSLIVVEHNMDVIKSADHVIDLGPEGGSEGGHLVFCGTPEQLVTVKESHTGRYLNDYLTVKKLHTDGNA